MVNRSDISSIISTVINTVLSVTLLFLKHQIFNCMVNSLNISVDIGTAISTVDISARNS